MAGDDDGDAVVAIGAGYRPDGEANPLNAWYVKAEVRGRDLMSGLPKTVILSPAEVREAISEPVTSIVQSVIACLGEAPPELAHDLIVRGMHLVGGGGMLKGLAHRIAEETEIPVTLVEQPLEAVVMGAGRCIEAYDQLRVMFMGARG